MKKNWFFFLHTIYGGAKNPGQLVFVAVHVGWSLYPIFLTAMVQGWKRGIFWFGIYCLLALYANKTELSPANLQVVKQGYAKRKADMTAALMVIGDQLQAGQPLDADDIKRVRDFALGLIVSYARGHRGDVTGDKIFATLLVEDESDGNNLRVIHRSDGRPITKQDSHPKKNMLAGEAFAEGRPAFSGDIKYDYPSTAAGKEYNSVLALPIFPVTSEENFPPVRGVVAIVSSAKHHFDLHAIELDLHMMPYTKLLAITL